jgi:glycosyltransferase involved in cell wall biosynthesis
MAPERSGIADYSALLLPALRKRVDVEVVPKGKRSRGADLALYHVGNDPDAHAWIVDALRERPGVVVLHDFVVHHLVAGMTLGRRDGHGYLDAMERDAGVTGRLLAYGVMDKRIQPLWDTRPEEFPLAAGILDLAREHGVVVHSRYAERRAREYGYDGPLWRVPHPAWPPPPGAPERVEGSPVIGCFGHLNASKRIPQLLEAFARLRLAYPQARLLLVGPVAPGFHAEGRIERLGLGDEVIRHDYVDEARFWALMAACDVCVSLRAPTMGETSGAAIRALSLGKPLVVSDLGWFAELPDDVALKMPVDEYEPETLLAALALLAERPDALAAMSASALRLARTDHDVEHVADLYAVALEEAAGGPAVQAALLREVAAAAAEVGIGPDDPYTAELAARLREAGLAR